MISHPAIERFLTLPYAPSVMIVAALIGAFLVMVVLKRFILGRVRAALAINWPEHSRLLVESLHWPLTVLSLCVDLVLLKSLLAYFEMKAPYTNKVIDILFLSGVIIAIVIFVNQLLVGLVSNYANKSETLKNSEAIVKGVSRIVILSLGFLVLLSSLGISITPVIASLGITSLAVALALQPTLKNFFSGVQLVIDKPIRVDDYIELDSGEQGFVQKIGWRSTWIKNAAQ